jgi:hypothetical protein
MTNSYVHWRNERTHPGSAAQTDAGDTATRHAIRREREIQHLDCPSRGAPFGSNLRNPVVAVEQDDSFLIALPYGERTDWMKNVFASGKAAVVTHGRTDGVDQPQVIPMTEATRYFGPKEQKLHRRFRSRHLSPGPSDGALEPTAT